MALICEYTIVVLVTDWIYLFILFLWIFSSCLGYRLNVFIYFIFVNIQ